MNTAMRPRATTLRAFTCLSVLIVIVVAISAATAEASTEQPGGTAPAAATPENGTISNRLSIDGRVSDRNSLRGDGIGVRGKVSSATGERVVVRLQVRKVGTRTWRQVATSRVRTARKFTIRWRHGRPGRYLTRLVVRSAGRAATDRLGAVYVYRATFASWYGPGFIGNRTACGQRLTGSILGVAHKTLPCGTRVTFHLHGRTVTARVIDRGPFAHGRDWDLTPALKRKLHFGSTGTVHTTS